MKKLFTKLSSDSTTTSDLVAKEPAIFTGSEVFFFTGCYSLLKNISEDLLLIDNQVRMIDDDIKLAQFAVAFEGASWTDPDSIALMVMQSMLGSWNKNAGGGKHMGLVMHTFTYLIIYGVLRLLTYWLVSKLHCSSDLAQKVGINEIAESMMAFNTNYKDTGLFGVYAVAKVLLLRKNITSLNFYFIHC